MTETLKLLWGAEVHKIHTHTFSPNLSFSSPYRIAVLLQYIVANLLSCVRLWL